MIAAGSYARKEQVFGTDFDLIIVVSDNTPVTPELENSLQLFRELLKGIDYKLDEHIVPGGFWVTESAYKRLIEGGEPQLNLDPPKLPALDLPPGKDACLVLT